MKAKLFIFEKEMEIRLSNGVQFFSTEEETKEDFTTRVEEVVDRDYVDSLEVEEVDDKKLKKQGSAQLEKKLESATGIEAKILEAILQSRGVEVETEDPKDIEVKDAETVEVPDKKEPKAKAEKTPKIKKEKVAKEQIELPSLESVIEKANLAKNNVQTICSFSPFRTAIKMKGEVKQVVIDRRVRKAYYRILGEDGKLYHSEIGNSSFKVDEEATEKMLDARESEAAVKAAAKKAKAEKAPKIKKEPKVKAEKEVKSETEATKKGKGWTRTDSKKS